MHTTGSDPVDEVIWMIRGQWVTLSITAGVELGLFDLLDAPQTLAELAAATSCEPATLARLVRVLNDVGLVEVPGPEVRPDDVVTATPRGATLSRRHVSGVRNLALMQTYLPNVASWGRLSQALSSGGSVFEAVNGVDLWESLSANPRQEAIFNASMARRGADQARAILSACDIADDASIVDVGGGSGAMLAELLRELPDLHGVVADRPDVADSATASFVEAGLADRARGAHADFFASVPAGGDVYVVANVLHDWADEDATRILRTIRTAMRRTARLWVVEHVLDIPDRPFEEQRDLHLVDLHMLVMFGARERTAAEYDALLTAAGFRPGAVLARASTWNVIETNPA